MPTEQEIIAKQKEALAKVPKPTHDGVTKEVIEQRKAINANAAPQLSGMHRVSKEAYGAVAGSPEKEIKGSQTARPPEGAVKPDAATVQKAAEIDKAKSGVPVTVTSKPTTVVK